MIYKDNILYLQYDEVKENMIECLKQDLLSRPYKFIGNIDKVRFSKQRINQELDRQGYLKKRIQQDGVRKTYYYKPVKEIEKRNVF